ncbi:MAG: hypothetical protein WAL66_08925 [Nitrososphaeraceae archaeon]
MTKSKVIKSDFAKSKTIDSTNDSFLIEVFLRLAYVSIGINDSSMDGELIVNLLYRPFNFLNWVHI